MDGAQKSPHQRLQRGPAVRASKDQRKLLLLAYAADHTLAKARLNALSEQTSLSPEWISRWFARQRKSDRKRAEQGCVDLTVKREQLEEGVVPSPMDPGPEATGSAAAVPPGPQKPCKKKKKLVKKEADPEALPLPDPPSSPSLRWSSPMLPSSSPPRTPPPHIAGPSEPRVYGDVFSSPSHPPVDAYSAAHDPLLGTSDGGRSETAKGKDLSASNLHMLSGFTSRALTGGSSVSHTSRIAVLDRSVGHGGPGSLSDSASGSSGVRTRDMHGVCPTACGDDHAVDGDSSDRLLAVSPTLLRVSRWLWLMGSRIAAVPPYWRPTS
ncbi:hypothetical protein BD309DRAFT_958438 [Dichomitus squalens]|uniref:Uncharacterized protein n=1 Tax=Dichomitus squalens TaxID=114155 RepID=A0A4Q9NW39_9APHY|nr:hypothetical protein BD309DRAFT_958438 [Dichomitus squalens]TBU59231.1 hypothetical protein BD310DRAFT_925553 [Dichomitus squalens]